MRDTNYYNEQSTVYSQKRYPATDTDYLHFFFKKRLRLLLSYVNRIANNKKGMSLLEIGCADGVVTRAIASHSTAFSSLLGVDVSPKMIEAARAETSAKNISFSVREDAHIDTYDVIVEVGVLHLLDLEPELDFVRMHLKQNGYYICSVASSTSSRARLKSGTGGVPSNNFRTFTEYDQILKKRFTILASDYYGLFIPLIWKVPFLARFIQPLAEDMYKLFLPALFHEKIYLLRVR